MFVAIQGIGFIGSANIRETAKARKTARANAAAPAPHDIYARSFLTNVGIDHVLFDRR
jgi:hypothetical protein